ncbi:MAG: hypothetical protein LBN39_06135 [Planctomycetaceae bacterium]|jgi:hypothetical protein|nr:hypothetical protein [Planctomycetaceae bacterium]
MIMSDVLGQPITLAQLTEWSRNMTAETDRQMKETDRRMKETDRQIGKLLKSQQEIRQELGGIGKSNGEYAEQFFVRALKHTFDPSRKMYMFGGREYFRIDNNWSATHDDIDEEYDIVLYNGDSVAVIEVKYKFKMHELKKFVNRKIPNFRLLYPSYADKAIYLGIAGFVFENGVIEEAKSRGIGILRKDGKNVDYDVQDLKPF